MEAVVDDKVVAVWTTKEAEAHLVPRVKFG